MEFSVKRIMLFSIIGLGILVALLIPLIDKTISKSVISNNSNSPLLLRVPSTFDLDNAAQWSVLEQIIVGTDAKVVELEWQGFGGYVVVGGSFINSIKLAQAKGTKIVIRLIGPAYSMHADVACYADKVIFEDVGSLNFHSTKIVSGANEPARYITPNDGADFYEEMALFKQCESKGFLTENLINEIVVNHNMIMVTKDGVAVVKDE